MKLKIIVQVISISIILLLTGCADFFQPRVPMDFDASNADLEDLLVEEKKGGKLGTSKQVLVSKNKDVAQISIRWSAVPNAIAYRIEYAVVSPDSEGNYPKKITNEEFIVLENSWYGTEYTHKITQRTVKDYENRYSKRYYYKITATNIRDGYEDGEATSNDNYGTLFAPPKGAVATAGESVNYINISWDFVPGAKRYQIFRSDNDKGAAAVHIKTVEGNLNQYKDTGIGEKDKGKEFYYLVYAETKEGILSEASGIAMGYSLVPGAPAKPNDVKLLSGRGDSTDKIVIKWNPVQGEGVITYNVFRYSSKDSSMSKVGRDLKGTEFADARQLEPNVYYYYLVQAVVTNSEGEALKSPLSSYVEGYILSPPQNLVADSGKTDGKVLLSWEKPIGNEEELKTYKYRVFGSNVKNGLYEEIITVDCTEVEVDGYAFFQVKTVKNDTLVSKESNLAAPPPAAPGAISVSKADYSVISTNAIANPVGVYAVKVDWEKSPDVNAVGYYVYRSLKEDSDYRKITNEPITELTYYDCDETLQPGKIYYYKVMSLNTLDSGKYFNEPKYGYGALTHEAYLKEFNKTIISSQKKLTLMHKPGSTEKLGNESKKGTISGSISYNAAVAGLGAEITMRYDNYADFYINPAKPEMGQIFNLTGNSDTTANMQSNGTMHGKITCKGMYPGVVDYGKIEIKAGAAGGGYYGVTPNGFTYKDVYFEVLEEK